jgi:hypothetical protein
VKPARLVVEDASAEETFGLFSLYGTLGSNNDAYSRVSIENGEWDFINSSVLDKNLGMMLDEDMTTAFRFTEVAEEDLVVPEATFALTPANNDKVDNLDVVKLSFIVPFTVTLKDISMVSLKAQDGSIMPVFSIWSAQNDYQLSFINVVAGTYTLQVADGAFTYGFFDKEIPVKAFSAIFTVKNGADFNYDFNVGDITYKLEGEEGQEYFKDSDLNTLTIRFKSTVTLNPNKTVFVEDVAGNVVATGHMEVVKNEGNVYKLVLDTPIAEGTLPAGTYTFVFEEGMFGDDNYASYLAYPYLVLMANCHVSQKLKLFSVKIDNEIATGINGIKSGYVSTTVYSISGQKLEKPRKGINIIGRKKVVVQ